MLIIPDLFSPYLSGVEAARQANWDDLNQYNTVQSNQLKNVYDFATLDPRIQHQQNIALEGMLANAFTQDTYDDAVLQNMYNTGLLGNEYQRDLLDMGLIDAMYPAQLQQAQDYATAFDTMSPTASGTGGYTSPYGTGAIDPTATPSGVVPGRNSAGTVTNNGQAMLPINWTPINAAAAPTAAPAATPVPAPPTVAPIAPFENNMLDVFLQDPAAQLAAVQQPIAPPVATPTEFNVRDYLFNLPASQVSTIPLSQLGTPYTVEQANQIPSNTTVAVGQNTSLYRDGNNILWYITRDINGNITSQQQVSM